MGRALLIFCVLASLVLVVLMSMEKGDEGERMGTPHANPDPVEPPGRPEGPRLVARPGAPVQSPPEPQEEGADGTRPWRVVVLSAEDEQPLEGAVVEAGLSLDVGGTPRQLGTTDAKGALEIAAPRVAATVIYVRKRGFVSAQRDSAWRGESIRLRPGLPVSGRVLRPNDTPVADAMVLVWSRANQQQLSRPLTTDDAGRFEIDGVPPNHPFVVGARVDGHTVRSVELTITRPRHGLVIRVGEGGVLAGVITRHDGTPGAGLDVRLLPPRDPIPERVLLARLARIAHFRIPLTQTDSTGRYAFPDVPLGETFEVSVKVSAAYEGRSAPLRFERAGERQQRDVYLPAPASLRVTVVDEEGLDIPTEHVAVRSHLGDFEPSTPAQGGGPFSFPELSPGDYELFAFVFGWPFHRESITLGPGESLDKQVVLRSGLTVSGVVVNSAGTPLAGVNVWWCCETTVTTSFGMTDEAGRFEIGGLTGVPGKLVVRPPPEHAESGRDLADLELEDVVPGGEPLRIVLEPMGRIRGRFPDLPSGTGLSCAAVSRSLWGAGGATLGPGGRFEDGVPVAREPFFLLFHRAGYAPLIVEFEAMEPGQDIDVGDLRFDQGCELEAAVEDEQGRPVAGARVTIAQKWSGRITHTDVDGRFAFERVPKRPLCLRIDAKGYPMHLLRVDGRALNAGTRLLLGKGGELQGTVLTSSGQTAAGADVTVIPDVSNPYDRDHDDTRTTVACDARGCFHLRLQPGAYRLVAHDESLRERGTARVEVLDGEQSAVEVHLKQ